MRSRSESSPPWTQPPALEGRPQMVNRSQLIRRRIQLDAVPNAPSASHQGRALHLEFWLSWSRSSTPELLPAQLGQKTYLANSSKLTSIIDKLVPGIAPALTLLLRFLQRSAQ